MDLELCSSTDCSGRKARTLAVSASFYRPFLDGSYQVMITEMMKSGCFDGIVERAILLAVSQGIVGL